MAVASDAFMFTPPGYNQSTFDIIPARLKNGQAPLPNGTTPLAARSAFITEHSQRSDAIDSRADNKIALAWIGCIAGITLTALAVGAIALSGGSLLALVVLGGIAVAAVGTTSSIAFSIILANKASRERNTIKDLHIRMHAELAVKYPEGEIDRKRAAAE